MNYNFFILLLFVFTKSFSQQPLTEVVDFGVNPGNLKLYYYNPTPEIKNKPLVVVLHGCNQNAKHIDNITMWSDLAKQNNFCVIYPQQKLINNPNLCFNWFQEKNQNSEDEILSIYTMIKFVRDTFNIDTTNIFLYGVSAGANTTNILCANFPWMFKASAVAAGSPYKAAYGENTLKYIGKPIIKTETEWGDLVRHQNPNYYGAYPKMIFMHGTKDFIVDFYFNKENIKQWCNIHQLSTEPILTETIAREERINKYYYGNTKNNIKIIDYIVNDVGHKIPVDSTYTGNNIFAKKIQFNSTLEIAKDFGIVNYGK